MPRAITILFFLIACAMAVAAQDDAAAGCAPAELSSRQGALAQYLTVDFENNPELALANLFRLGILYQSLALECGYEPNAAEVERMLAQTLAFVSVDDLLIAQSVGQDVEAILLELDALYGDPLNGQALYNGIEPALGGVALGCSGCHENAAAAPLTAGTWTRVNDIRLGLPQFADYSLRQYLVESIVEPMAYITPDYTGLMPEFYGGQMTAQHLADLVAFLESQDQLLEEE